MKNRIKRGAGCVCFLGLTTLMLYGTSKLLESKKAVVKYHEFYDCDTDIDVIFMGTSHMYNSLLPQELWDEYGITSYNWGYSNCTLPEDYYILQDIVKEHKPKVVVVDIFGLFEYEKYLDRLDGARQDMRDAIGHAATRDRLKLKDYESGLKKTLIMKLFKIAYRGSACIMFQNSTNMKLAKDLGWVKGDCKLIPGSGVALDRYPVQEYPVGGDGLEGEPVVFNYIGRILHDKGVDDYIEAAKRIKTKYPKTEFNMLGFIEPTENHYEAELEELGKQGIVLYRGSQKDVKPWIKRAHAIIHPSTYGEGMSNVLLENASSGRLIITTDNPGCQETVNDCISGFIYHGGDVDALVQKIETVVHDMPNDVRKSFGLEGRKKVEREFSREVVIKAYLGKIKELTER